jgi:hypothetical protein
MSLFIFLFLGELGTCPLKSHAYKRFKILRKISLCTRRYVEIYIQRPFLDNKKDINFNFFENSNGKHML